MSYSDVDLRPAIQLDETTRGDFVVRVYQHLLGAIVAFAGIDKVLARIAPELVLSGMAFNLVVTCVTANFVCTSSADKFVFACKQFFRLVCI